MKHLTVQPYREPYSNIDILDDIIPNMRFKEEFPDGVVPIKHTAHLFWAADNYCDTWQALADTVTVYDKAREHFGKIDAEHVATLVREMKMIDHERTTHRSGELPTLHRDRQAAGKMVRHSTDGRGEQIARELMLSGLKIGPLKRLVPNGYFRRGLMQNKLLDLPIDKLEAVDAACLRGDSYYTVAKAHGVSAHATMSWWKHRGHDIDAARSECVYWYMQHTDEFPQTESCSINRSFIIDAMQAKYPFSHFKVSTIAHRARGVLNGTFPPITKEDTWTKPTNWTP